MKYFKFKGTTKKTDYPHEVIGYGCYTDSSARQFIITDDPVDQTFVQVEQIEVIEPDEPTNK